MGIFKVDYNDRNLTPEARGQENGKNDIFSPEDQQKVLKSLQDEREKKKLIFN